MPAILCRSTSGLACQPFCVGVRVVLHVSHFVLEYEWSCMPAILCWSTSGLVCQPFCVGVRVVLHVKLND